MTETPCGDGADARYCETFWSQHAEIERLQAELDAARSARTAAEADSGRLRALLALVNAHFVGNGPYPLQLVCSTEDASDAECDQTIAEVEPGVTWDELEAQIAAHAAEYHAAAAPAEAKPQVSIELPAASGTEGAGG